MKRFAARRVGADYRSSPVGLLVVAAAALLGAGCPDSVGISCPPELCGADQSATASDLAVADASLLLDSTLLRDLTALPDLTLLPDLTSCQATCAGCCDQSDRCQPVSLTSCGVMGQSCQVCDSLGSDHCDKDGCRCGMDKACDTGLHCIAGQCSCDKASCPGCCQDPKHCRMGDQDSACGSGGALCYQCPNGQSCKNQICDGCNPQTCANGCCTNTGCQAPSAATCGNFGLQCNDCGASGDTCLGTLCRCGMNPPCGAGQRCVMGQCACDPKTCRGCCMGDRCDPGNSPGGCGVGGVACVGCATGQGCEQGACVCNKASCPTGCCHNNVCTINNLSACGTGGGACAPCERADACVAGVCTCTQMPACAAGQACTPKGCAPLCNQQSCPNGCCSGVNCLPGNTATACGAGGMACGACGPMGTCANGVCLAMACPIMSYLCATPGVAPTCMPSCAQCAGQTVHCGNVCVPDCSRCAAGLLLCGSTQCVQSCANCPNYPHTCGPGLLGSMNSCVAMCSLLSCPLLASCQ